MTRSIAVAFIPYLVMLVGIPFVNSSHNVGGLPVLALWIAVWVFLTPAFLLVAERLLPAAEREENGR